MKSKKIIIIFSSLLIIILLGGYFAIKYINKNKEKSDISDEYIPQEEISEDQLRQTIVSLYFMNKETKQLVPEARLVDIKEIINDPCGKLVQLLIEGPKSDKNERIIPQNIRLNKCYMDDDCVILDFTEEILNINKTDEKDNLINSLVNTLTQLTEVNSVKIIINGNESNEYSEIYDIKK